MNSNAFTLKDFLALPEYSERQLLTKVEDPSSIELKHIGVSEGPVSDFIRQGEMVLTTAMGCRDSEHFLQFLTELHRGGAAAVAVTFDDADVSAVPESGIRYATDVGMPLIWLPWEYRFAEIVETVLDRIRSTQSRESKVWEDFQRRLLEIYLQKGSITHAAESISRQLGCRIALCDASGRVLADTAGKLSRGTVLSEDVRFDPEQGFHLFTRVDSQNRELGEVLCARAEMDLERLEKLQPYASYLALPLLLWFDRDELTLSARARRADDTIWAFSMGRFDGSVEALAMARQIGLRPERPHLCLAARLRFGGNAPDEWLFEHGSQLNTILPRLWPGGMIALRGDQLTAFTPKLDEAESMVRELSRRLGDEYPGLVCSWGISEPGTVEQFGALSVHARLCADLAQLEGRLFFRQREGDLYRLLSGGFTGHAAREIIGRWTRPLKEYDAAHKADLQKILLAYFKHGCNASETARALHFHRQSLLYKLARAEELLGITLTNHEEALTLELCLRALEYENITFVS